MSEPLDRRAFLALLGGSTATLLASCGGEPAARAAASTTGISTSAGLIHRRPPGVDSLGLPPATHSDRPTRAGPTTLAKAIRGQVLRRGAPGYSAASHVFNERFDGVHPAYVVRPVDAIDVREAIRFTVGHGIALRARSGGHSYAGYSTLNGGVMLDLRRLNRIAFDRRAGTATIGAGAQLIDVYATLAGHGVTIPGGSCPSVGIAGSTLGGGMGLAGRAFGLTTDNLIAAEIVTADGGLRTVSERSDPDLLWALRGGGGGNFGVVTAFTYRVHPLPANAGYFNIVWPWSSAAEAIDAWQAFVPKAPPALTSILHLNSGATPSITANGQFTQLTGSIEQAIAPLTRIAGAAVTASGTMPYVALQQYWAGCFHDPLAACHTVGSAAGGAMPRISFNAKSDYVGRPLSSAGIGAMVQAVEQFDGNGALLCDAYGGAINRVAPGATAFVHRDQLFCIQYYGDGPSDSGVLGAWRRMRPYVSGQAYQNYIDPSLGGWRNAYYGANLPRLVATRAAVDPHRYFSFPQAI